MNPLLTRSVFDDARFVNGGPRLGLLATLVGAMVAITLTSATLGVWQTLIANRLGNRVMQDLRDRLFSHLQRMDLAFFTATRTGQIQSRLGNDVGGVQSVVTDTASTVLSNVVVVTGALIAMFLLSWQLTLVSLILLPLFVWLQVRVGRTRRAVASDTQSSLAEMTAITEESLSVSGMLLSKIFNRQATEVARYRAENARQAGLQVTQTMTGQWFFAVVRSFFQLLPAVIYLVTGTPSRPPPTTTWSPQPGRPTSTTRSCGSRTATTPWSAADHPGHRPPAVDDPGCRRDLRPRRRRARRAGHRRRPARAGRSVRPAV